MVWIVVGVIQFLLGYLVMPLFVISAWLGNWLTERWNLGHLPITNALASIAIFALFFGLQVVILMVIVAQIIGTAASADLARVGSVCYLAGLLAYWVIPAAESRMRGAGQSQK